MLKFTSYELNDIKSLKEYTSKEKEERTKVLFNIYVNTSNSTHYLIGFIYNKKVYTIKIKELSIDMVKLATDSKGGLKLRLRVTKAMKEQWIASGKATYIMTEKNFNKQVNESIYNKGEILEKITTEKRGQEWIKDSIRYDQAGDINLKRDRIQVKFWNASLTRAKTMIKVANAS